MLFPVQASGVSGVHCQEAQDDDDNSRRGTKGDGGRGTKDNSGRGTEGEDSESEKTPLVNSNKT